MADAFGRIVPETPENIAKRDRDLAEIARQQERDREATAKAEARRLAGCERRGIIPADCPRPAPVEPAVIAGTSDTVRF